jgi:hypothetical protein
MPPLKERLRIVIGQDTVTIDEAIRRLTPRRWLPECSDVRAEVSHAAVDGHKRPVRLGVVRRLSGATTEASTATAESRAGTRGQAQAEATG